MRTVTAMESLAAMCAYHNADCGIGTASAGLC